MKKFLTVLSVIVLFAVSSFASVITVTKENSEANYPGTLAPGSLTGTNVFISDLYLLPNSLILEADSGTHAILGAAFVKTDMGIFGLTSNNLPPINEGKSTIFNNFSFLNNPTNVISLDYATDISAGTLGLAVQYGVNSSGSTAKDLTMGLTPSNMSAIEQYIGLKAGLGMKNMDVSLGLSLRNQGYEVKQNLTTAGTPLDTQNNTANAVVDVNLNGRMDLGNNFLAILTLDYLNASKYDRAQQMVTAPHSDIAHTTTNSEFQVIAQLGKDLKATKTLTVKMAAGLGADFTGASKVLTENKITNTKTYNTNSYSNFNLNIPLNVAVEGKLNDTWSVNAGTSMTFITLDSRTDKTNKDTTADTFTDITNSGDFAVDPVINYAVGLTGVIGDLTIDMFLDPSILLVGPNFISGGTTTKKVLNNGIALSYNWK